MVYRIYVEKKKEFAVEAANLASEIKQFLKIDSLEGVRVLNRYDVEGVSKELFESAIPTVFSEPQTDTADKTYSTDEGDFVFATEFLPGQFDQRADSAAQCIQIISGEARPTVRGAKIYVLKGNLSDDEIAKIKKHVINPVEMREAALSLPETLAAIYDDPDDVAVLNSFINKSESELAEFIKSYGLAMDLDDIKMVRDYFASEKRDPTITEIRMIDTYWSDHCRHTTFLTNIDNIKFEDELIEKSFERYQDAKKTLGRTSKPNTLMDMATTGTRYLKNAGKLKNIDESDEINACTVKIKVDVKGQDKEDYLLLFKNETHNHPTEIEPFGGAATCIGGAIRDPLSGRAYVYSAMRVTGAADPLKKIEETRKGKLPQRKIVTTAAAGYSSYGNQIGLATGKVDEIYHSGYAAKRMEIGAVLGAVPEKQVRREEPAPGDVVILLGGATGRDGCGGATGSSKSHDSSSLETCGAEVQKGNAPEERKLQRLFRDSETTLMIKRCNDFGAGGVSVAVGELADGLRIDLDKVPKKYDGLDGTELAISESQERMAVVVSADDVDRFIASANRENLSATVIATVTEEKRLVMSWRGKTIVDVSREFLNTNGADKHIDVTVSKPLAFDKEIPASFEKGMLSLADDLNVCSKRGLSERFDSTIGSTTVLMPFGGKNQITPTMAMVNKIPTLGKDTSTCSVMSYGFNPFISEKSPYHGAYLAVVESLSKLVATCPYENDTYMTFQEYFEKLGTDAARWGKPTSALLGSLDAQLDFEVASIGGKDSMSGSFEDLDVPPTLVSFAVTTTEYEKVVSPEFKEAGHKVILIAPKYNENSLPDVASQKEVFALVTKLMKDGKVHAASTLTYGGVAEAVMKMAFGNSVGFKFEDNVTLADIFGYGYGSFLLEVDKDVCEGVVVGYTTSEKEIVYKDGRVCLDGLSKLYENKLESVFPMNAKEDEGEIPTFTYNCNTRIAPSVKVARPRVLIPVFPGTNCEYDTAKAVDDAGGVSEIFVVRNLTKEAIAESAEEFARKVANSQIVVIPGGFSGADEPDGSGKFITAFMRNERVSFEIEKLLSQRDGLMCGICNGFQALIKLGLVPYGKITPPDEQSPTLTYNSIGRHQSKLVRTRVVSNKSPWLYNVTPGDIITVPISHGEGRLIATDEMLKTLIDNGQIATQYVDFSGLATSSIDFNPNNSMLAIEGITSPDGRVLGKMGHSERIGRGLYKNVIGDYDLKLFRSGVEYFR